MFSEEIQKATVTADGTAVTGAGEFYGCAMPNGTAIIYDNTAASGTVVMATTLPGLMLPAGTSVRFANGLHVDLTTATHVTVYYMLRGA